MNDMGKARNFPKPASVFQSRYVYVPGQVSNFIPALVEEKSTPLNFLYFSTQLPLKIWAKQSKTAKNACI